jgi:EAL domain-containing protein (putative c-di-GMP-specific phosphodiesterase class I)
MVLVAGNHRSGETRRLLDEIGLSAQRVVIEISEQYPLDDFSHIGEATRYYRNMGFEIAIDDLAVVDRTNSRLI